LHTPPEIKGRRGPQTRGSTCCEGRGVIGLTYVDYSKGRFVTGSFARGVLAMVMHWNERVLKKFKTLTTPQRGGGSARKF